MALYHVTLKTNRESIVREGLCPFYAKGKLRAVWLVSQSRILWAIVHICTRDKVNPHDVLVLECVVPLEEAKRFRAGIHYTEKTIPVEDVWGTSTAADYVLGINRRESLTEE